MHRSGTADLPIYSGKVPQWLADRMSAIGTSIITAIIEEFGSNEDLPASWILF